MANSLATKKNVQRDEQSDGEQLQENHAGPPPQRVAAPAGSGERADGERRSQIRLS
jgi:hypothetical protein